MTHPQRIRFRASLGIALLLAGAYLGGCGDKKSASPPVSTSDSASADSAAGVAMEAVQKELAAAKTPEQKLIVLTRALGTMAKTSQELRRKPAQWREANRDAYDHFAQRFHELYDVEGGLDPHNDNAAYVELLNRILAARRPEVLKAFTDGQRRRFYREHFDIWLRPQWRTRRTPTGTWPYKVIDPYRGKGNSPPVKDIVQACADYVASFRENVILPRTELRKIAEVGQPLSEQYMDLAGRVFGCSLEQWLAGEGEGNFADKLIEFTRKHVPEHTDLLEMIVQAESRAIVRRAQSGMVEALRLIHACQKMFHEKDLDDNGMKDYWTADLSGLYRLRRDDMPLGLGTKEFAVIDGAPLGNDAALSPRLSSKDISKDDVTIFLIRAVPKDADGKPLAEDADGDGHAWTNKQQFAFCAYPCGYGRGGRQTYLIDRSGVVYFKDTSGKPVEKLPADPAAEGWATRETEEYEPFVREPLFLLLRCVRSKDPDEKSDALRSLGNMDAEDLTPAIIQAVVERIDDDEAEISRQAAEACESWLRKVDCPLAKEIHAAIAPAWRKQLARGNAGVLAAYLRYMEIHREQGRAMLPQAAAGIRVSRDSEMIHPAEGFGRLLAGLAEEAAVVDAVQRLTHAPDDLTAEQKRFILAALVGLCEKRLADAKPLPSALAKPMVTFLQQSLRSGDRDVVRSSIRLVHALGPHAAACSAILVEKIRKHPANMMELLASLVSCKPDPTTTVDLLKPLALSPTTDKYPPSPDSLEGVLWTFARQLRDAGFARPLSRDSDQSASAVAEDPPAQTPAKYQLRDEEKGQVLRDHLSQLGSEGAKTISQIMQARWEDNKGYFVEQGLFALANIGPDARGVLPIVDRASKHPQESIAVLAALTRWRITGDPSQAVQRLTGLLDKQPLTPTPEDDYDAKPNLTREIAKLLGEMRHAAKDALPALRKRRDALPKKSPFLPGINMAIRCIEWPGIRNYKPK